MTHTVEQPGLHEHSWSPEHDLMKRYVIEYNIGSGWVAFASVVWPGWNVESMVEPFAMDLSNLLGYGKHVKLDVRVWDSHRSEVWDGLADWERELLAPFPEDTGPNPNEDWGWYNPHWDADKYGDDDFGIDDGIEEFLEGDN